ncbi:MAG: MFS transporter [Oscillospiraceae bacterium]
MKFLKGYTKQEKSWMMYDWANSAQSVIIVTLLPIFYNTVSHNFAMIICAVLAPLLGALGDFKGWRKRLFFGFMAVGVLACLGLVATPFMDSSTPALGAKTAAVILTLYIICSVGHSAANIYYDSFLTDVTTDDRMDKVSTMGYGMGYIGGSTIPLLIFLIMNLAGVDMTICLACAFAITAVWWSAFSVPIFKNVQQKHYTQSTHGAIKASFCGLGQTLKEIVGHKKMLVFLLAYFFYIDGVNTIISMSTIYGSSLGLDGTKMMLALLLVQILGLPFALMYIRLSEKFGTRFMVGVGICVYMFITVFAFFIKSEWQFWLLSIFVASSQGGIQALSRSLYGKLIPDKARSGEFFGFYDIFGKFSAIMGPALVAFSSGIAKNIYIKKWNIGADASAEVLNNLTKSSTPWGVLSVLIILVIGGVLFFVVYPRVEAKENAAKETRV